MGGIQPQLLSPPLETPLDGQKEEVFASKNNFASKQRQEGIFQTELALSDDEEDQQTTERKNTSGDEKQVKYPMVVSTLPKALPAPEQESTGKRSLIQEYFA